MSPRSRFSIHKRIEGGATGVLSSFNPNQPEVSVSTSGSKGVQPLFNLLSVFEKKCFSIHKRIEGGATFPSLATVRINLRFQYPQADRRGCNVIPTDFGGLGVSVSVSTSGSKGVQRGVNLYRRRKNECFSIHKRIEGGATTRQQGER